jgi:DsbC/DsbD-like thiol-disulfide interchange protein
MPFHPVTPATFSRGLAKMNPLRASILVAALLAGASPHARAAQGAPTGVAVELLADVTAVVPGVPFRLGVRFTHQPGFHTYWQAPGIVGMATTIDWQLPEGFRAGPLQWPPPEQVKMLKYRAFGFDSEVLLVAQITPPPSLPARAPLKLTAHATWMACASTCHPGTRLVSLELPVGTVAGAANKEPFAAAASAVPRELVLTGLQARIAAGHLTLSFTLPPDLDAKGISFIPETNLYDPNTEQKLRVDPAGHCELSVPVMPLALESLPATLTGLILRPAGWPQLDGATFGRISVTLAPPH